MYKALLSIEPKWVYINKTSTMKKKFNIIKFVKLIQQQYSTQQLIICYGTSLNLVVTCTEKY